MSDASSSATATAGGINFGDDSPSWIIPAILIGALLLGGIGWLLTRNK